VTEASPPETTVSSPEAILEQQDQVGIVVAELTVVESLSVVGIGTGVKQRPG